jgi:hypothetical protein
MTSPPIEFASLDELQRRDVDTNGTDREAAAELRRRWLAAKLGGSAGRDPRQLLAELERIGPYGPMSPQERALRTYAKYRGPDPRRARLALAAVRILAGW